jgi:hypothetical protein
LFIGAGEGREWAEAFGIAGPVVDVGRLIR